MFRRTVYVVYWFGELGNLGGISVFKRRRQARCLFERIQADTEYLKTPHLRRIPFGDRIWR